jgi:hypothetical protein
MEEVNASTLNDKNKKLHMKISSLLSSAENFQTLKLYEDSLKLLLEARDLTKSLSKKELPDEPMKNLFNYLENNIKYKIKTVEMLNIIEKEIKSNKQNSPIKEKRINYELEKYEMIKTINTMIAVCDRNLKELADKKPGYEKSLIITESQIINQSFVIPNKDVFYYNAELIENMENSFNYILIKLKYLSDKLSSEETMKAKKDNYTKKLEKLKIQYATIKKILEAAIRSGVKI